MSNNYFLKICLLGDGAVGKTSLREQFMGRGFRKEHQMTIGADFASYERTLTASDGREFNVTFQIWDLAGQETFQGVRARFFKGSLGALVVYDVTRPESFMNLTKWIEELWRNNGRGILPIVLLGNKADLRDGKSVSEKKSVEYAQAISNNTRKNGFDVQYMNTSAKTGLNVEKAFDTLGLVIIDMLQKGAMKIQSE
jgi:Ras-related protein Rab-2A